MTSLLSGVHRWTNKGTNWFIICGVIPLIGIRKGHKKNLAPITHQDQLARGRSAAAGPDAWVAGRPTLHGGPVRLRPVRATPCLMGIVPEVLRTSRSSSQRCQSTEGQSSETKKNNWNIYCLCVCVHAV